MLYRPVPLTLDLKRQMRKILLLVNFDYNHEC